MKHCIEQLKETKLVGLRRTMSFAEDKTPDLWKSFMPYKKEIKDTAGSELYSLEIYHTEFFIHFNPKREFEKWAAVRVNGFDDVPHKMETLLVPAGMYAVFLYKGRPSESQNFYQNIYTTWLPESEFELDQRPHFALMGENYKGEDPDSEEEIWIPVKDRK